MKLILFLSLAILSSKPVIPGGLRCWVGVKKLAGWVCLGSLALRGLILRRRWRICGIGLVRTEAGWCMTLARPWLRCWLIEVYASKLLLHLLHLWFLLSMLGLLMLHWWLLLSSLLRKYLFLLYLFQ